MIKLKNILQPKKLQKEWADEIKLRGQKKIFANYDDDDAMPFVITAEKNILFGLPGRTHLSVAFGARRGELKNSTSGRVWFKKKIISFWEYPNTREELNLYIKLINNSPESTEYVFKINPSWMIDIPITPEDISGDAFRKYSTDTYSVLIPIQEYDPEILKSKKKLSMIKKYRLQKHRLHESVNPNIEPTSVNFAKSAMHDIFISRPSRSISKENWKGFRNFIIGNYGKKAYAEALKSVKKDGFLTIKDGWYQWKKSYSPVNQPGQVNEYTSPAYSGMETSVIERPDQYLPKNVKIKYKHPNDEPIYDVYREKKP